MSNTVTAYTHAPGQVLSFGTALQAMTEQTELIALIAQRPERSEIYREVVRIAADVYCRRFDGPVVVDGDEVTFGYLQAIYRHLTGEHIEAVVDKLEAYPKLISRKKAFIRTMLYNTVFELQTETENRYAANHSFQGE